MNSDIIYIPSFHKPVRKDRVGDNRGGVLVYVKDCIHFKRRVDLELGRLECIWNEITLTHKYTHFTEHTSSIIDLLFVSTPRSILLSGVGEHFLEEDTI